MSGLLEGFPPWIERVTCSKADGRGRRMYTAKFDSPCKCGASRVQVRGATEAIAVAALRVKVGAACDGRDHDKRAKRQRVGTAAASSFLSSSSSSASAAASAAVDSPDRAHVSLRQQAWNQTSECAASDTLAGPHVESMAAELQEAREVAAELRGVIGALKTRVASFEREAVKRRERENPPERFSTSAAGWKISTSAGTSAKSRALAEVRNAFRRVCVVGEGGEQVVSRKHWTELVKAFLGGVPKRLVAEILPDALQEEIKTHRCVQLSLAHVAALSFIFRTMVQVACVYSLVSLSLSLSPALSVRWLCVVFSHPAPLILLCR